MDIAAYWSRLRADLAALPPAHRRAVIAAAGALAVLLLCSVATTTYLWRLSRRFPAAPFAQPSRLYGRATRLAPGTAMSAADLLGELSALRYRRQDEAGPLAAGRCRRAGDAVAVHLRRFPTADGPAGGTLVEVAFRGGRIARVREDGREVAGALLEPPLLASFYGPDVAERRPVALAELPRDVIRAVLAAEDSGFYRHPGVSPTGIARALWVDLRGGEVQQGGSTITQQLVKNVYLSSRRTLARKAKEALIAVMLELRHGKRAILEAYLNEIYWGRSGPANLIGLGAAARAYFGKDAAELTLAEAATLAGMIRAPGEYSPLAHPEAARERRDRVLARMAELGWVSAERARQAAAEPLVTAPETVEPRPFAPYFADAAAAEAASRFHLDELADAGYRLFSTLGWREQKEAEAAVAAGLADTEATWERGRRKGAQLQAALLSVDPRDGAFLAYVGGRDYERSQFDRVAQARRQAGSAFKPVVYAAAFADGVATPATLLRDSPIVVRVGNEGWSPQNYDRAFHGVVTVRTALEQSLNIPTVRVALQVGLPRVAGLARELGFTGELQPVPALALGSFSVTPRELAEVYATLAGDGARPPLHGLAAVRDRFGEPVLGDDLPAPRRVLPPETAYLVTALLQGVLDHGTAGAARGQGITDRLAGKTGTTNDRRDSWFAGYSPDRATVVWIGYDDNSPTHLSGARAALPIWSRFTRAVRPAGGYLDFTPPSGVVMQAIDPTTGQLATAACPVVVDEVFAAGQAPSEPCQLHADGAQVMAAGLNGAPLGAAGLGVTIRNDDSGDRSRLLITNAEEPADEGAAPADPAAPQIVIRPRRLPEPAPLPPEPEPPADTAPLASELTSEPPPA
jgi:penicillin-binding protein 1B